MESNYRTSNRYTNDLYSGSPISIAQSLGARDNCHGPIPGFRPVEDLLHSPEPTGQEVRSPNCSNGLPVDYSLYTDELTRLFKNSVTVTDTASSDGLQSQIGRDLTNSASPTNTYELFKSPDQPSIRADSVPTTPVQQPVQQKQSTPGEEAVPTTRSSVVGGNSGPFPTAVGTRSSTGNNNYNQIVNRSFRSADEVNILNSPYVHQKQEFGVQKLTAIPSPRVAAAAQTASVLFPPVPGNQTPINNSNIVTSLGIFTEPPPPFVQYNNAGINGLATPSQAANVGGFGVSPSNIHQLAGLSLATLTAEAQRRRLRFSSNGSVASCTSDEMSDDFTANLIDSPEMDQYCLQNILIKMKHIQALAAQPLRSPSSSGVKPLTEEELQHFVMERKRQNRKKRASVCVFCKNNGEIEAVYISHTLKDATGRVTCPILRAYTCPNCGSNGDVAHTVKYCPLSPNEVALMGGFGGSSRNSPAKDSYYSGTTNMSSPMMNFHWNPITDGSPQVNK